MDRGSISFGYAILCPSCFGQEYHMIQLDHKSRTITNQAVFCERITLEIIEI
jgi:hypothetical protein